MFTMLGAASGSEQDVNTPFLGISRHFTVPMDTRHSTLDPCEYRVVPEAPLSAVAKRTGKKRKAVRFAVDTTAGPILTELDPSIHTLAHHFGSAQMQVDEEEEPKSIDPGEISQYEAKTPLKKAADYPGHNLKKRIFKQIEDG
jgi:hypothetical protein